MPPLADKPPTSIVVVTSSRADYSHLYWPLQEMLVCPDIEPRVVVTGAQLSPEHGMAADVLEDDGVPIWRRLPCLVAGDDDVAMAKTIGVATHGFAALLAEDRPDAILVIADRYEMLAPAATALALRIPIVHIEGGERSEGAIDHAVRNALTAMSHVHLVTTERARARVIAMGEEPWRVHRVGAASLDHVARTPRPDVAELEQAIGLSMDTPPLVVAHHPVTLDMDTTKESDAVFEALEQIDRPIVFCFPNADAGGLAIGKRARQFCDDRDDAVMIVNLAPRLYWGLLHRAAGMLGNSSSGVMESTSIPIGAVNIGRRQHGREHAANVIDVEANAAKIVGAVEAICSDQFARTLTTLNNPYGDGSAAPRIVDVLRSLPPRERLLDKRDTLDELLTQCARD